MLGLILTSVVALAEILFISYLWVLYGQFGAAVLRSTPRKRADTNGRSQSSLVQVALRGPVAAASPSEASVATGLSELKSTVGQLESALAEIKKSYEGFVTSERFEVSTAKTNQTLRSLSQTFNELKDRIAMLAVSTETEYHKADQSSEIIQQRLDDLGKSFAEASVEREAFVGLCEGLKDMRSELETLQVKADKSENELIEMRGRLDETHELVIKMPESLSRLPEMEDSLAELIKQVSVWQETVKVARKELSALSERIDNGMAAPDEEVQPTFQGEVSRRTRERRNPRIISSTARSKYREVVDLWMQGNDIGAIAVMTGLDDAEVELLVAGERRPTRS